MEIVALILVILIIAEGFSIMISMFKEWKLKGLLFFVPGVAWYFIIKYRNERFKKDWLAYIWLVYSIGWTILFIFDLIVS